jgi:DNA polymerase-3 subunit delta'
MHLCFLRLVKKFDNMFIIYVLINLINYKINDMENIIFTEELETISILSTSKTKNRLIDDLENTLSLKSRLNNYINERLAFDNLMLNLERR